MIEHDPRPTAIKKSALYSFSDLSTSIRDHDSRRGSPSPDGSKCSDYDRRSVESFNEVKSCTAWLRSSRDMMCSPGGKLCGSYDDDVDDRCSVVDAEPRNSLGGKSTLRIVPINNSVNIGLNLTANVDNKIIAPNVGRLSASSTVEVQMQSLAECVIVVCSVDILKMKSGFFYGILSSQEEQMDDENNNNNVQQQQSTVKQSSTQWRPPIIIPETSPFEAAAFLESLHEGRALFKGEWNISWARLSVTWQVEDLIKDYALQVEDHVRRLLDIVERHHWRKCPKVLVGCRVALFRKSTAPIPTVICGEVIEPASSTAYSKVRIAFDAPGCNEPESYQSMSTPETCLSCVSENSLYHYYRDNHGVGEPLLEKGGGGGDGGGGGGGDNSNNTRPLRVAVNNVNLNVNHCNEAAAVIGDVSEPFWVQRPGQRWSDPDELFLSDMRNKITVTDKNTFWEMLRAIIELPSFAQLVDVSVKDESDMVRILKAEEYRILWTSEAPNFFPSAAAADFIRAAYIKEFNDLKDN
eukprot:gene7489-15328_t